jgi:hypothetical protein
MGVIRTLIPASSFRVTLTDTTGLYDAPTIISEKSLD